MCMCVLSPAKKKKCLGRALKHVLRAAIPSPCTHIRQQACLTKLQLHYIDHKTLMMVIYLFMHHLHYTFTAPQTSSLSIFLANSIIGFSGNSDMRSELSRRACQDCSMSEPSLAQILKDNIYLMCVFHFTWA